LLHAVKERWREWKIIPKETEIYEAIGLLSGGRLLPVSATCPAQRDVSVEITRESSGEAGLATI
jgi:hypothetical protein